MWKPCAARPTLNVGFEEGKRPTLLTLLTLRAMRCGSSDSEDFGNVLDSDFEGDGEGESQGGVGRGRTGERLGLAGVRTVGVEDLGAELLALEHDGRVLELFDQASLALCGGATWASQSRPCGTGGGAAFQK